MTTSCSELRSAIQKRINEANETLPTHDDQFPLRIVIEPTNICNLSCIMCPSVRQLREKGVMPLALWKKIMDETAEKSPQTEIWPAMMGEALTAGEIFFDMLEYTQKKRFDRCMEHKCDAFY